MDNRLKFHFVEKYSRNSNFSKNQKKSACSRIEVTTGNLSRDRNAQLLAIPGHDINKFFFEEETEKLEQVKS